MRVFGGHNVARNHSHRLEMCLTDSKDLIQTCGLTGCGCSSENGLKRARLEGPVKEQGGRSGHAWPRTGICDGSALPVPGETLEDTVEETDPALGHPALWWE